MGKPLGSGYGKWWVKEEKVIDSQTGVIVRRLLCG